VTHHIRWTAPPDRLPRHGDLWTCECGAWGIAGDPSMVSANTHAALARTPPWPDRAAASAVHATLMALFLTIAAGRAMHRTATSSWHAARALAATAPWGRTR
jgi:hypothetical protein